MNFPGVLGLLAYASVILWLAGKTAKTTSSDSFFVNRRSSSSLGVALSIVVSCVGASATVGVVGLAFKVGTPAFWWLGMGAAGLIVLAFTLAEKVRSSGAFTMPQLVESLIGPYARKLVAGLVLVAWVAILAAQFTALSRVLQSLLGIEAGYCLLIGYLLVVVHSLGGQAAVMRVDRIQFLIIFVILLLALGWISCANWGWWEGVKVEASNASFPPSMFVYFLFVVGGNYVVCPMLFGRVLSARSTFEARRGAVAGAVGLALFSVIIVGIGLGAVGLVPASTPEDSVLSMLMVEFMPGWLGLLMSVGLVSAIVSSADSCLITVSTVFSLDLLGHKNIRHNRVSLLSIGLLGLLFGMLGQNILHYLLVAYDIYFCGVVVPVFIALLLSDTKYRIEPRCACAAIVVGGACGAVSGVGEIQAMSYVGMSSAALLCFLGLFLNKRKKFALKGEEVI